VRPLAPTVGSTTAAMTVILLGGCSMPIVFFGFGCRMGVVRILGFGCGLRVGSVTGGGPVGVLGSAPLVVVAMISGGLDGRQGLLQLPVDTRQQLLVEVEAGSETSKDGNRGRRDQWDDPGHLAPGGRLGFGLGRRCRGLVCIFGHRFLLGLGRRRFRRSSLGWIHYFNRMISSRIWSLVVTMRALA